jgi:hypothetical protein
MSFDLRDFSFSWGSTIHSAQVVTGARGWQLLPFVPPSRAPWKVKVIQSRVCSFTSSLYEIFALSSRLSNKKLILFMQKWRHVTWILKLMQTTQQDYIPQRDCNIHPTMTKTKIAAIRPACDPRATPIWMLIMAGTAQYQWLTHKITLVHRHRSHPVKQGHYTIQRNATRSHLLLQVPLYVSTSAFTHVKIRSRWNELEQNERKMLRPNEMIKIMGDLKKKTDPSIMLKVTWSTNCRHNTPRINRA